ncbi:C4-dicarboxylate ABC transporter [Massilia sp. WF1]|uniref:TRAP transporter substrate-binding protein DctP n=1 Tax=unclassified Massilia TaxID=2609279 RepID=UPI0006493D04|nr:MULTISPECIES: TRAP transporter substrate-binding protein DctP [unclassified Massilia]ALK97239.1 C4-dicarboxylate ABC transporter [Massilia sp. WG5]KLU36421.1 C4-dicarboxylate ABC transporter [Massilia sp. WF1]
MSAMTRRTLLGAIATSPLWLQAAWAQPTNLKISHQFPGGSVAEGDFRDRLCRMFASETERRTKGRVKFSIYPHSTLMKSEAQIPALAKGQLDMSLVPLTYAGATLPEVNIGLLPGLVTSYEQGYSWKDAEIGQEFKRMLADRGIVILSWIWQAGGVASRGKPIVDPEDAAGLKVRGGSHEMDMLLREAGANVVDMPSNEIRGALEKGTLDAAMTSSSSLISFRLDEVSKYVTTARGGAYWFMLEPLLISKTAFDRLPRDQQATLLAVGAELEAFARRSAQMDDAAVAALFQGKGGRSVDLTSDSLRKWQDVARATAWKDYGSRNENCAKLLALAEKTLA